MKYAYLILLGVLTAGLAGCGGGGDDGKNDMIAGLETDLEMIQEELREAQGELETTKETLTETQTELGTTKETLTETQTELGTTKETLTETQTELGTTKETLTDTQGELGTTKETLETTKETLETTKGTLETTQNLLDELDEDVDGLLAQAGVDSLEKVGDKLREEQQAFDTLDAQVKGLQSFAGVMDLDGLRGKLAEFQNLYNTVDGLLSFAGVMDLPELRTKLQEGDQAYTDLQGAVDAVIRTTGIMDLNDSDTVDVLDLQIAYNMAKSDYDSLNTEVQSVITTTGIGDENNSGGMPDVADLQMALNNAQTAYNTLNSMVQNALQATDVRDINGNGELDLADLQAYVTNLEDAARRLQGQVNDLRGQVDQGNTDLQDQLTEAEQATVNARAGAYLGALTPAGDAMPTPRTGVSVTHDRGGSLTINPGGNFQTGSGAPGISGFTARAYTREVGVEGEETLYLYTNIQAPSTRHFWKIHGLEVDSAHDDDFNPTPTASARYITDSTDSTMATGVRVSGRYDGVSGTFTCVDSDCMGEKGTEAGNVVLADLVPLVDGERSFAQGIWTFKPSSITSGVSQMRDREHLYFGIWVREPNVASEEHAFQYIAGGLSNGTPGTETLTNFGALSGTATFGGGAIGKYVTRNQVGENAKIGTFTASANFTANFDADNLEGRITNFRDGGQALPGDWNVYLGATDNMPATFTGGSLTGGVSSGRIGGVPATGDWSATLYGTDNIVLAETDREDYPATRYPVADLAGLTGSFRASSINTALAGTFGATPSN